MSLGTKFPPCPPQLKSVQHYLKIASDYEEREPAICYWSRLYALQSALKIDRKSPEAKLLLSAIMDWLETFKKLQLNNEAVTNDIAGQAVVENEADKLFTNADELDRAGNFNKNVVKSFYCAGVLYDIIQVFGELNEELMERRKYAKWKATYIHNCLKRGETPIAGPVGGMNEELESQEQQVGFNMPSVPSGGESSDAASVPSGNLNRNDFNVMPEVPPNLPAVPQAVTRPNLPEGFPSAAAAAGAVNLSPEYLTKAQKYCKFAISSLDYEDTPTAINYLTKALSLLTTGRES